MQTVIDIKFRTGGKVYYFDPAGIEIHEGDNVIVETQQGPEFTTAVSEVHEVDDEHIVSPLKPVIRVATQEDKEKDAQNRQKEAEAFDICTEKIAAHGLDMKLSGVEYAFSGSKITFYFTADGRIDFRALVKDLASVFKTRIELRQIGVRDEARLIGGYGSCGRKICCNAFLNDFVPASIKMAKEQGLSLNPTKISGICGRLMCCLQYEQECYESMRKLMPCIGKEVSTCDGPGVVLENNVITERTKVKVTLNDGTPEIREYSYKDLEEIK